MSQPVPEWVSFDAVKTTGLDLLGLRAPVQQISNELFNGVTTITPKLRYLSVISWILWRYSQARLPDKKSSFMEFAAAQEAVIVMANRLHSSTTTNLVGVEGADTLLAENKNRVPLKKLAQNIAFNAYISSTRQLHMTRQTDSGFNGLVNERGVPLAKEFDKIIQQSSYGPRLAKKPRLDAILRSDLQELSEGVSLAEIPPGERTILIDALMPSEPIDIPERNRLANYGFLLWLSAAKQALVTEEDVFEAGQVIPDGLPDCLSQTADGWLEYVIRDLLAVTHEAVFGAVMRRVDIMSADRQSPAISAEVLAALVAEPAEKDEVLRELRILKSGESVSTVSFRTVRDRVQRLCRKQDHVANGLRRWNGGLSETVLYDLALESHDAAIALLPVAWCLAAERVVVVPEPTPFQRKLLARGGIYQIGLSSVVLPKVDEFIQLDRSLSEVMVELTRRTVQQHLRVAWSRFSTPQGKDVSVLVADVETWSRNNPFRAGRTDPRLRVALNWLQQLLLTDESGLTKKGAQILKRCVTVLGKP
jgi:hypothetical protein